MTREEFYKLTDILNSEVLGNFMHGGEADELIAMFEETVEHSNILEQEKPVSEELEEAAKEESDKWGGPLGFPYKPWLYACFMKGAKWQKEQDQSTIELAEDHAMLAGMEKMKEQMMEKAVEVTVHIEAGNYPYIPQIELYDYDKDAPLAKEGDKYKVILIKEDRRYGI